MGKGSEVETLARRLSYLIGNCALCVCVCVFAHQQALHKQYLLCCAVDAAAGRLNEAFQPASLAFDSSVFDSSRLTLRDAVFHFFTEMYEILDLEQTKVSLRIV